MMDKKIQFLLFFLVVLVGCQKENPQMAADHFWTAIFNNDLNGVKTNTSESSVSSIVMLDEILPISELKRTRIQYLKLQQFENKHTEPPEQSPVGLRQYEAEHSPFALGDPSIQSGQVVIPTTLFAVWEGNKLTWHLNTRLVKESGSWKVDFMSLKYDLQHQLEAETRGLLMSETRNISRAIRNNIRDSVQSMSELYKYK